MAAVTICSDFGAPQNKVSHCFSINLPYVFLIFFHFFLIIYFIFWLCWVFIAACGLSLDVASREGGYSLAVM